MNATLHSLLAKNWWMLLLRGIAAIAFGVMAIALPGLAWLTMVILFGAYAAVDGVLALAAAFQGGTMLPRWWLAMVGIFGLAAAIVTFLNPNATALVLIMFIGAWAVARGVVEIVGAIQLRKEIDNEWLLALSGALSLIFGLFVLFRPGEGAVALAWLIGSWSIALGIVLIALALRLRAYLPGRTSSPAVRAL